MKKIFTVVLSFVFAVSFVGCKTAKNDQNNSSAPIKTDNSTPSTSTTDDTKTDIADVIYYENSLASDVLVEFKDESGNILIKNEDVSKVSAKLVADVNQYAIQLDFTKSGAQKLENATQENIGKPISIYIDGQLIISPVVYDVITDGKVLISNLSSKDEMLNLYYSLSLENPLKENDLLPLPQNPAEFIFSSGAGAWATVLKLNNDGTFTGDYHDSEMGTTADEYPNGSVYISVFSGKFTNFEKINDYSYKMTVTDVETRDKIDTEWIDQEIRYIAAAPYGIDGGTEFILYLPNTPINELPEEFLYWWPLRFQTEEKLTTLSCYGILNVATNDGFFTCP